MARKYPIGLQSFREIREGGFVYVDKIYVLELKLDGSASEALDQIFEKGYLQPYAGDEPKKLAIGIAFSSEQMNIADYRVKERGLL